MARVTNQQDEHDGADELSEGAEPSQSQARLKWPAERSGLRPARISVRPTAFGVPRPSRPSSVELSLPPATAESADATPSEEVPTVPRSTPAPPVAQPIALTETETVQKAVSAAPAAPEPARVNLVAPSEAGAARPKRSRLSLLLFVGMLSLSGVSLWRYLRDRDVPNGDRPTGQTRSRTAELDKQAPEQPAAPAAPTEPAAADSSDVPTDELVALVAEANRALAAGDHPTAERLFARVVAVDEDNPRAAYGLSQIRLAQGNLSGAEGWIQLAIKKRPRRAEYHELYARILERLGNTRGAEEERANAAGY